MKQKITITFMIITIMMLVLTPMILGDTGETIFAPEVTSDVISTPKVANDVVSVPEITSDTEIFIGLTTEQDITSLIVENSAGNVDNTLICNGNTCTTTVIGGDVIIPEGQTFNYNSYQTAYVTKNGGDGVSINGLTDTLEKDAESYYNGDKGSNQGFFALLESIFVSHKEFRSTYNNVDYLAKKIDRLEAQVNALEKLNNLESNKTYQKNVDDRELKVYADRTGDYNCFDDGLCIIVKNVK